MLMSILDFFVENTEKISKPGRVKIEHLVMGINKLENLLNTLEKAGLIWTIYKHSFQARRSNRTVDYVCGVKIKK